MPLNVGWRTWPSGVHSENVTSATSLGSTHRSLPFGRLLHRPFVGANPMPDLRWGGPALIDAVVEALAMREQVPA